MLPAFDKIGQNPKTNQDTKLEFEDDDLERQGPLWCDVRTGKGCEIPSPSKFFTTEPITCVKQHETKEA